MKDERAIEEACQRKIRINSCNPPASDVSPRLQGAASSPPNEAPNEEQSQVVQRVDDINFVNTPIVQPKMRN